MLLAACLVFALVQNPVESVLEGESTLAEARVLLVEAGEAVNRAELDAARSLGKEALDLLLPSLSSESGGSRDQVHDELYDAALLVDKLIGIGATREARSLLDQLIAGYRALGLEEHSGALYCRALRAYSGGETKIAKALFEQEVEARKSRFPDGHPTLTRARGDLGAMFLVLGELEQARPLQKAVLAAYEATLPAGHPYLVTARSNLAVTCLRLGEIDAARVLQELVVADREHTLPEDHPQLIWARANLAVTLGSLGEHETARALWESVLAAFERTRAEDDHDLLWARGHQGETLRELGEFEAARRLQESVISACERTLPEDHVDLVAARNNLATTLHDLGELESARLLKESVLASFERTLPEEHSLIVGARSNLAGTLRVLGQLEAARGLDESVLASRLKTFEEDHPELVRARANLAVTLEALGDLEAARMLQEMVLESFTRTRYEDHSDLVRARGNLATTLGRLGDHEAGRALEQLVLDARERTLAQHHPDLVRARGNLGATLHAFGEFEAARLLQESVLESCEKTLPEDHPDTLLARANLAVTLGSQDSYETARLLTESVLASRLKTLPDNHPEVQLARSNLASVLYTVGELDAARALDEVVLAAYERTLPEGHPDLVRARSVVADVLACLGDLEAARSHLPQLASGMLHRLSGLVATSPREAREIARGEAAYRLCLVLFLSESGVAPEIDRSWAFDLVETLRHVSQSTPQEFVGEDSDSDVEHWQQEAARLRASLNDLVAGDASTGRSAESFAEQIERLAMARDRVERLIRQRLSESGQFAQSVRAEEIARALEPGSAAVGFLLYKRVRYDAEMRALPSVSSLLAHVVRPGERPVRIELGPGAEIETLVREWRTALGRPVNERASTGRGASIDEDPSDDSPSSEKERMVGELLRRRILDPVLEVISDAHTLNVCLDDLLYLVPLDSLPLDGGRVGDRFKIVNEVSFARLVAPRAPSESEPGLLALGGVDYDAEPQKNPLRIAGTVSPPIALGTRGEFADYFAALSHTRVEVETLSGLFEETFGKGGLVLKSGAATKAALHDHAPGSRYVHLATHGWFAPESVSSTADERSADELWQRAGSRQAVTGLAPMTLCGLALAGANTGRDSLGRVPGILTAEELAAIDLSQCELAVLSACETNVGMRRAGQGIQSLQSALHAAGARTSVTSLWRVDDALTRQLMELFYTNLWIEKMPKAEALWAAKKVLREGGAPVRDWAGWLLTGDPN